MKFRNVKLLEVRDESPYKMNPYPWTEATPEDATPEMEPVMVVGKLRPWDDMDDEYILYSDGDIMLGQLFKEVTDG